MDFVIFCSSLFSKMRGLKFGSFFEQPEAKK
nr:MAG TPA: hypothetical protein [Caudoviricetes sp.]